MEILELIATTGYLMSFLEEIRARAVETKRDLKKMPQALEVSKPQQTSFTDKVASVTEGLSSISVECVNFKVDLDEMTWLVQRLKEDDGKSLYNVSAEFQKPYEDKVDALKLKMEAEFVNWWKEMETHFQVKYTRLVISAGRVVTTILGYTKFLENDFSFIQQSRVQNV